jgi:hypothetical protein
VLSEDFLSQLQVAYYRLDMKYHQMWNGLYHRIFTLDGGWFNGHFERSLNGGWVSQSYPLPVISVKGYCDVEIGFDKITVSTKRKRADALSYSYKKVLDYSFEAYGVDDYLQDYYRPGDTIEAMKTAISQSNEDEIGFSFTLPWETNQEQIYEFVKLLRREGFYY